MFASLLSIVDTVFTLDEGCVRKDLISGDSLIIEGNYNRDVSGRISGVGSLACVYDREQKDKKFFIIVGKHKIALTGDMDLTPKPQSLINQVRKSIRITTDDARYLEIRFNDSQSFSNWLIVLGECLAEVMCFEAVNSFGTQNAPTVSTLQHCISTCELLASPSKECVQRMHKMYEIKQRLHDVMRTLRTSPCDVSVKDIKWLKESCRNVPEMSTDLEMRFLLERLPQDRYTSYELQVILKDIMYADMDGLGAVVCAQAMSDLAGTAGSDAADCTTLASAVLIEDTGNTPAPLRTQINASSIPNQPSRLATTAIGNSSVSDSIATTTTAANTAISTTVGPVKVPAHKKSRIALNGVEIQSNFKSPSSAGKVLAKQIKIKSKFTTPAAKAKDPKTLKSKSPINMGILSDIRYNVSPVPVPVSASAGGGINSFRSPVRNIPTMQRYGAREASQDKENTHVSPNITVTDDDVHAKSSPMKDNSSIKKICLLTQKLSTNTITMTQHVLVRDASEEVTSIETCTPFVSTLIPATAPAPPPAPLPASFVRTAIETTGHKHALSASHKATSVPLCEEKVVTNDCVTKPTALLSPRAHTRPAELLCSSTATPLVAFKGSSPVNRKAPGSMEAALSAFPDATGADIQHAPVSTAKPAAPPAITAALPVKANYTSVVEMSVPAIVCIASDKNGATPALLSNAVARQAVVAPVPATEATANSRGKKNSADHAVRSPVRPLRAKPSLMTPTPASVCVTARAAPVPAPSVAPAPSTQLELNAVAVGVPVSAPHSLPAPALQRPFGAQVIGAAPALTPVKITNTQSESTQTGQKLSVPRWILFSAVALLLSVMLSYGADSMLSGPLPVNPIARTYVPTPGVAEKWPIIPPMVTPAAVSLKESVAGANLAAFVDVSKELREHQQQPASGGMEVRVSFEGASTEHTPHKHANIPKTRPLPSSSSSTAKHATSTPHSTHRRALAVHDQHGLKGDQYSVQAQSRVLQDKLRRLMAFLSMPVRAARSFFRTAVVKFQQIRQVLQN